MKGFLEELQPGVKLSTRELELQTLPSPCRQLPCELSPTLEPHLISLPTIHGLMPWLEYPENGLPIQRRLFQVAYIQGPCCALNTSGIFYPSAFGPAICSLRNSLGAFYLNGCLFLKAQLPCPNIRGVSTLRSPITHIWGELYVKLDLVGSHLFGVMVLYQLGFLSWRHC